MMRVMRTMLRIIELIVVVISIIIICLYCCLNEPNNLQSAIERIGSLTGYKLTTQDAELILHESYGCHSVIIVADTRNPSHIKQQMVELMNHNSNWEYCCIPETETYSVVDAQFTQCTGASLHFRPVCEIGGGEYDYLFKKMTENGSIYGGLVDADTGTIAVYVSLD